MPSSTNSTNDVHADLLLTETLRANTKELYHVPLQPLDCSFGLVTSRGEAEPLHDVIVKQCQSQKADVAILFAVRRPGCASCREHGEQLSHLAALQPHKGSRHGAIALIGVIKERVHDEGILEFHEHYYKYPLYLDEKWKIFHAMGCRKLTVPEMIPTFLKSFGRYKKKRITNKAVGNVGDHFTQGGLLIFDKKGELRYACDEVFGAELNLDAIQSAIDSVRKRSHHHGGKHHKS